MGTFLIRRVLWLIPVLFFVALMTFILMHVTPGGPWDREKPLSPAEIANLNAKYNLDKPLPEQFFLYLWNVLHGDFGPSYTHPDRTISEIIKSGAGITVQLGAFAFIFSLLLGLPLGIIAALKHNSIGDYASMFFAVFGYSIPSFVLATFFIVLFAAILHMMPTGGWGDWHHWILPPIALGMGPAAAIARYTRSSMLDVIRQDFVRTGRAKGLRELRLVSRHEIRNALLPVVTIMGPTVAYLVTGSFVVEEIFRIPGIGTNFVDSILSRDYPLIMASVLLYASAVALANLLVDLSYGFLDPRIRY